MHHLEHRSDFLKILVALVAAFMLVACGGGDDPGQTGNGTPNGQEPNGEEPDDEEPDDEEPDDEEPDDEEPDDEEPDDEEPEEPSTLAKGTFTKRIEGSGILLQPFSVSEGGRHMYLLHAGDVAAAGELTAVRLERAGQSAEAIQCPGVTLRVGHSSMTALAQAFDDNVEEGKGSFAVVVDDADVIIPAGDDGELFEIAFDTPYPYNGVDNLVLEISRTSECTGTINLRGQSNAGYTGVRYSSSADSEVGAAFPARLSTHFVFEGGEKHIIPEDGEDWGYANFSSPQDGARLQFLILARDIGGEGPITGIGFSTLSDDEPRNLTYSVTLSHIDQAVQELETDLYGENTGSDALEVATGETLIIPAGAAEFWMPLTDSFDYDGVSNLLIEVRVAAESDLLVLQRYGVDANRVVGTFDATAEQGVLFDIAVAPTLRFHGGTLDVAVDGSSPDISTFTNNVNGRTSQYLYYGAEIGSGGTITRMACRLLTESSSLTAYPNFQVVMSHTDALELDDVLENNLLDPEVVYEGTFVVPAGLIRGDWIEIPLDEGFEYDATQNLVIQVKSDGGENQHRCAATLDAERYENRRVAGSSNVSLSGTLWNQLQGLRLWIER